MTARTPKKTRTDENRGRKDDRKSSADRRRSSPSPGRNLVVGWGNKCFHCGSDAHTRKDCKSFDKMMRDANVGKPKDQWKPPAGYKSALGKAREAQKTKNNADKKKINAVVPDDDSDSDSDLSEVGFSINALRPLPKVLRKSTLGPINAVNRFNGLDENQDYDPDVLASLNSWAHEVRVAPSKVEKQMTSDP